MPDLDPAHVEAVAELVAHVRDQYPRLPTDVDSHEIAETLLTSTDPDVHAALLAALAPLIEARVREAYREGVEQACANVEWHLTNCGGEPRCRVIELTGADQ